MGREMTVGQWCERTVWDLRHPQRLKPTSNWRVYATLLRRLRREGTIVDVPLCKVSDRTFKSLIKWMGRNRESNFEGTLKVFTALINRAHRARLTRYVADFPYMDFAPKAVATDNARLIIARGGNVHSLTPSQWQAFLSLDLSEIRICNGPQMAWWKELYRDFCRLLYLLKSRPIDVLQLHSVNIAVNPENGRTLCSYIPAKKRNQGTVAVQYLFQEAIDLIGKYAGKSKGGYVLPFKLNQRRWNLDNAAQFEEHYREARNQLASINRFLSLVGRRLGLPFPLTLYCIRRSAISHAIIENRIPLPLLAKMAGTSVRMIELHYANYLHTLEEY